MVYNKYMNKSTLAKLLFLLATVFFGMAYVFIREGVLHSNPYTFLFYRFLLACIIMFLIFSKKIIRTSKESIKYGLIIGIPFAIAVTLLTIGLQTTIASKAGFLGGLYIIFVPLALRFIKREKPLWHHLVAISIAVLGAAIISLRSDFSIALGDILVILWAVFFAVYIVLVGKFTKDKDSIQITFIQFVVTLLLTGIIALLTNNLAMPHSYIVWQSLFFIVIFATIITYLIQNRFQRYVSEVTVGLIYTTEPIFAALSAFIILNEKLTMRIVLGGGLIFLALVISELPFNRLSRAHNNSHPIH